MRINTTADKVSDAIEKIKKAGGMVVTNGRGGAISIGEVKARFLYEDNVLTIVIDDKPWLATMSMIEDEINKFFR